MNSNEYINARVYYTEIYFRYYYNNKFRILKI